MPKTNKIEVSTNQENIFSNIAAPAQRALLNANINSIEELAQYSIKELLKLHGMGKSSIPKLQQLLSEHKLHFKP
ncbi:MAG: hypothetical protein MH472_13135 [Bacteroidia bacterium]|nr:hypothetical protein [Bacteroidia bacterium]